MHHPVKNIAPPTTQKGPDDVFFVVECQINDRTAPPPAIRDIALMSGGILCKGVVLKVHRVINYNSMYIIIGYDVSTPLMTMYEIMTLCKHRMVFMQCRVSADLGREEPKSRTEFVPQCRRHSPMKSRMAAHNYDKLQIYTNTSTVPCFKAYYRYIEIAKPLF